MRGDLEEAARERERRQEGQGVGVHQVSEAETGRAALNRW